MSILSSSGAALLMLRGPVRYANDGMLLQAECESVQDDLRLSLIVHSCVNCTSNGCPIYNTVKSSKAAWTLLWYKTDRIWA